MLCRYELEAKVKGIEDPYHEDWYALQLPQDQAPSFTICGHLQMHLL